MSSHRNNGDFTCNCSLTLGRFQFQVEAYYSSENNQPTFDKFITLENILINGQLIEFETEAELSLSSAIEEFLCTYFESLLQSKCEQDYWEMVDRRKKATP